VDGTRFDLWTRHVVTSESSRRFAIRALTGVGLSALIGVAYGENAIARRKKRKKNRRKCKGGAMRCGTTCVQGVCCPDTACSPGCRCERGVDGATVCTLNEALIGCVQCASDDDCPAGRRCVQRACFDATAVCVPECQS
jgi:hypothetical protein